MTDILDSVIQGTLVNLVRRVQWGLTRDALEGHAKRLTQEASYERGMADNHFTANSLVWQSDLYDFAAQVRFPRDGDLAEGRMRRRVKVAMRDMVEGIEDEWTPQLSAIHGAINQTLDAKRLTLGEIEPFIFAERQLEEDRELERQAEFWKTMHPEDRKEAREEKAERFAGKRPTWDELQNRAMQVGGHAPQPPSLDDDRRAENDNRPAPRF